MIRPGTTSSERLRRFEHEAKVLARLQHAGIAQIFEADIADAGQGPQPFFAMELIDGVTLATFIERKSLPVPTILRLFTQVCHAIQHAHQRGIIHRDLKPDNILVDKTGQPKLIDFGVARLADRQIAATQQGTRVGQILGTPHYMSPEQIQADPDEMDTRSDVYSLGVICYELLSGKRPYKLKGLPLERMVQVITQAEPPPLSSINREFRGDLDTIVLKAMEKDKNRRYQSAGDLAADIERYLTDQPIQARPASALYQMRKFARRNKALVGGVVATLMALVLGLFGTTWWAMVAHKHDCGRSNRSSRRSRKPPSSACSAAPGTTHLSTSIRPSPKTRGRIPSACAWTVFGPSSHSTTRRQRSAILKRWPVAPILQARKGRFC